MMILKYLVVVCGGVDVVVGDKDSDDEYGNCRDDHGGDVSVVFVMVVILYIVLLKYWIEDLCILYVWNYFVV